MHSRRVLSFKGYVFVRVVKMFAYLPLVIVGTFVYRVFIYKPVHVETHDKTTQTEPWCGVNVIDLMEIETDCTSDDTWAGYFSSDCSNRDLEDKKDV